MQRAVDGQIPLRTRGEAHITVVTPPELEKLGTHLSFKDVVRLSCKAGLKRARFTVEGLGRAGAKIIAPEGTVTDRVAAETYFLVVSAPGLQSIRDEILDEFVARGGLRGDFKPEEFEPHITIGFTHRDLHRDLDGVTKGSDAIVAGVP